VDSGGYVGEHTSIAAGTDGTVHISYLDWTNGVVKYAKWNGSSWEKQTIENAASPEYGIVSGGRSSIALDGNNYPHISYFGYASGDCGYFYTRWNGSSWTTPWRIP